MGTILFFEFKLIEVRIHTSKSYFLKNVLWILIKLSNYIRGGGEDKLASLDSHTPLLFLYFLPLYLTPFAPFLCIHDLCGLSCFITKECRILLSLTLYFNIAVIYGSRLYFNIAPDFDDDFSRYYQTYLDVYDNIDGAFGVYGGGF